MVIGGYVPGTLQLEATARFSGTPLEAGPGGEFTRCHVHRGAEEWLRGPRFGRPERLPEGGEERLFADGGGLEGERPDLA